MKVSEIKGDNALDVLADIMEPAAEIMTDKQVVTELRSGNKIKGISLILKNHKKSITTILAVLDGEDPETYQPTVATLPIKLLEIINDPDLSMLFISQSQNEIKTSSGSVTENTEANEE